MKIGLISGFFNPLHPGHIDMFREAKSKCDQLIVVINNDKQVKDKGSCPFYNEKQRRDLVAAVRYVDFAIISDDDTLQTIRIIKPDIMFQGADRKTLLDVYPPEYALAKEIGAHVMCCTGGKEKVASSSELLYQVSQWHLQQELIRHGL